MSQAELLIENAKKRRRRNELITFRRWSKNLAAEIEKKGVYEDLFLSTDKTFSFHRHYLSYLRKIGFKVTLLKVKYSWRYFYSLRFKVELDEKFYEENMY